MVVLNDSPGERTMQPFTIEISDADSMRDGGSPSSASSSTGKRIRRERLGLGGGRAVRRCRAASGLTRCGEGSPVPSATGADGDDEAQNAGTL
jgi:hypothetical protein